MELTAHDLVQRGAALLDEKLPGWADQIDLDMLKMDDACHCVLGQIGGNRYNLDRLSWETGIPDDRVHYLHVVRALGIDGRDFGFNDGLVGMDHLRDAWKGEIVARRTL